MHIWVDADACPNPVKEILYRAAERWRVEVILVANQPLRGPRSRHVRSVQVEGGFDVADRHIAERASPGDLVVTADIPLAALVVDKGALAINPRGELYTRDNIAQRLATRNLMEELRSAGVQAGGPAPFHARDRQAFANQLDRILARHRDKPHPTKES